MYVVTNALPMDGKCVKHSIVASKALLVKDARSVSLYPYNRSQILYYVKYTKQINIAKEIVNFCDK